MSGKYVYNIHLNCPQSSTDVLRGSGNDFYIKHLVRLCLCEHTQQAALPMLYCYASPSVSVSIDDPDTVGIWRAIIRDSSVYIVFLIAWSSRVASATHNVVCEKTWMHEQSKKDSWFIRKKGIIHSHKEALGRYGNACVRSIAMVRDIYGACRNSSCADYNTTCGSSFLHPTLCMHRKSIWLPMRKIEYRIPCNTPNGSDMHTHAATFVWCARIWWIYIYSKCVMYACITHFISIYIRLFSLLILSDWQRYLWFSAAATANWNEHRIRYARHNRLILYLLLM